jgi:hypothetical protein
MRGKRDRKKKRKKSSSCDSAELKKMVAKVTHIAL